MDINIREDVNDPFVPIFRDKSRYLVLYGGAGAGKSYATAQKMIINSCLFKGEKMLIIRKTFPALRRTAWEMVRNLYDKYHMNYLERKNEFSLEYRKNRLLFLSLDDPEKIKSMTDVNKIWIEEATELTEEDFIMLDLRMRGERLKEGQYRQIITTFNPIDEFHWIKKRFFDSGDDNISRFKFTYRDNRYIDEEYIKILQNLKEQDYNTWLIYSEGEWGHLSNLIFTNYKIEEIPLNVDYYDEVISGADFGWNNPCAYPLIGLKDLNIYILDEIYRSYILNPEFIKLIKDMNERYKVDPDIYPDTSEPDRIEEMRREGLRVIESDKKVKERIDACKKVKIFIHPQCVNFIKEIRGYSYKEDKDGHVLDEPVKFNDHLMDSFTQAYYAHTKNYSVSIFKKPRGF